MMEPKIIMETTSVSPAEPLLLLEALGVERALAGGLKARQIASTSPAEPLLLMGVHQMQQVLALGVEVVQATLESPTEA